MANLMLSGIIGTPCDHDLKVAEDGMSLKQSFVWPQCMTCLFNLIESEMESNLRKRVHRPRVLSPRSFLKRLRSKADQKFSSLCSILLLIQVEPDIALVRRRRPLFG